MRRASKWIVSSLVAAGLCAAVSTNPVFAKRDPDVAKALKEQYPDAKTEITRSRDINGVKVNDVKITTKDGDSTAEVTEYGDFLLWGMPRNASSGNTISAAAAETLQGLFKGDLKNVDVYKTVNYLVDVQTSKKTFRLRLDPVGRLRDVDNSAQMKQEQASLEKASGGDAKKAEQTQKRKEVRQRNPVGHDETRHALVRAEHQMFERA